MKVPRIHLSRLLISLGSTGIEGHTNEELLEDVFTHPPTHLSNETQKAMLQSLLEARTKGETIEVVGEPEANLPPQVASSVPVPAASSAPPAPPPPAKTKPSKEKPPKEPKAPPKPKEPPKEKPNDTAKAEPPKPAVPDKPADAAAAGNGVGVVQQPSDKPATVPDKRGSKPVPSVAEKSKGSSEQARPSAKPKAPKAKEEPKPPTRKARKKEVVKEVFKPKAQKAEKRNKAIARRMAAKEKAQKAREDAERASKKLANHKPAKTKPGKFTKEKTGKSIPALKAEKKERKLPKTKNGKVIGRTRHRTKGKGPGIIAKMVSILEKAGPRSAVTKDLMLEKLIKAFPDRDPKSMRCTVMQQMPTKLKGAGHDIRKSEFGYWIK